MKREKVIAITLTSTEAMQAMVADIVRLKIEHAEKTAAMEKEVADVQKHHQDGILATARLIEIKEASVYTYCQRNRAQLFAEKKSIDMLLAEIGFELNPPSGGKRSGKDTWVSIARRLESLDWGGHYVREGDPEVNKQQLLNDRTKLTPDQLVEAGIKFEQEEQFFIRPKSQVAADSVKEAA